MESERGEYRAIAERRVRLGLLLSEIGQRHSIQINENEMNQLVMQAAQQYRPEDRQKFVEYVQNEPMAAAQLRAPLFEDKVVDFLFAKAEISERTVSRETLQAEIEFDRHRPCPWAGLRPRSRSRAQGEEEARGEEGQGGPRSGRGRQAREEGQGRLAPAEAAKPAKKAKAPAEAAVEACEEGQGRARSGPEEGAREEEG